MNRFAVLILEKKKNLSLDRESIGSIVWTLATMSRTLSINAQYVQHTWHGMWTVDVTMICVSCWIIWAELRTHTHTREIMFGNRQTYKWRSCDLCPMRNHQDIGYQCLRVQSRFYVASRTLQFTIINLPMNILRNRRRKTSRRRKMVRARGCPLFHDIRDGHDRSCRVLPQLQATIQTIRMIFLHLIATHIRCEKPHRHTYSHVWVCALRANSIQPFELNRKIGRNKYIQNKNKMFRAFISV